MGDVKPMDGIGMLSPKTHEVSPKAAPSRCHTVELMPQYLFFPGSPADSPEEYKAQRPKQCSCP